MIREEESRWVFMKAVKTSFFGALCLAEIVQLKL